MVMEVKLEWLVLWTLREENEKAGRPSGIKFHLCFLQVKHFTPLFYVYKPISLPLKWSY